MGFERGDVSAGENNLAADRPFDSCDGADERRLAGAVGADQSDHRAFFNRQRDAGKRRGAAVVQGEVGDFQ